MALRIQTKEGDGCVSAYCSRDTVMLLLGITQTWGATTL